MATVSKRTWTHAGQAKEAWVVRYLDDRGVRRSKQFERKKEADGYRLRAEREMEAGIHTPAAASVIFKVAVEAWILDCERRWRIKDRMAGRTLEEIKISAGRHTIPAFGKRRLSEITAEQVQDFINEKAEKYCRATVRNLSSHVKRTLDFAVKKGWLKRNPMIDQPPRNPAPPADPISVPSREDLRAILKTFVDRKPRGWFDTSFHMRRVAVFLALFAGFRGGEICGLSWENIDFEHDTIRIRHSLSRIDGLKGPKSRAGIRDVHMAPPLRSALEEYRDSLGGTPSGPVLVTRFGSPMQVTELRERHWRRIMKAAGLTIEPTGRPKYHFHSLRHAYVSLLIEQGLKPIHIQRMVGHSKVSVTLDVYAHLFPDDDTSRDAVRRLSADLSGAPVTQIGVSA